MEFSPRIEHQIVAGLPNRTIDILRGFYLPLHLRRVALQLLDSGFFADITPYSEDIRDVWQAPSVFFANIRRP
jgi:hypothetical protein